MLCEAAFDECKGLRRVEFQNGSMVENIPRYCFRKSGLEEIVIAPAVKKIEGYAFDMCTNLRSVQF